jgi:hypothetical protein
LRRLIGFEADREKGLHNLRSCLEDDAPSGVRRFATLTLVMENLMKANNDLDKDGLKGLRDAEELIEKVRAGVWAMPCCSRQNT